MSYERIEFKEDGNFLIGPDGGSYLNEADYFYIREMEMCGCGRPESVHKMLNDILTANCDDHPNIIDHKKAIDVISKDLESAYEFIMHVLENKGMTEHGGSVYGSWITDKGKHMVECGHDHGEW